jgi:cation transport ATPase
MHGLSGELLQGRSAVDDGDVRPSTVHVEELVLSGRVRSHTPVALRCQHVRQRHRLDVVVRVLRGAHDQHTCASVNALRYEQCAH